MSPEWFRYFSALGDQTNSTEQLAIALLRQAGGDEPQPAEDPVPIEDLTPPAQTELGYILEQIESLHRDSRETITRDEHQPEEDLLPDVGAELAALEARIEALEARASSAEAVLSTREMRELQGAVRYVWRDILGPVTGINPLGAASDPDVDSVDGTLLFDDTTEEVIALVIQVNHDWAGNVSAEGLTGRLHVHWSKTTDAAGDVEWEYRYRIFSEGDIPPSWSAWAAADTRSSAVDATQKQIIDGFPDIDMSGQEVSCIVSIQVRRNPAAADDTYGADAKLWSVDMHYLSDSFKAGSDLEYTKLNWSA